MIGRFTEVEIADFRQIIKVRRQPGWATKKRKIIEGDIFEDGKNSKYFNGHVTGF